MSGSLTNGPAGGGRRAAGGGASGPRTEAVRVRLTHAHSLCQSALVSKYSVVTVAQINKYLGKYRFYMRFHLVDASRYSYPIRTSFLTSFNCTKTQRFLFQHDS